MFKFSRKSIHKYEGQIGEVVAWKYLEKQGFKVRSCMGLVDFVVRRPLISASMCSTDAHEFIGTMKNKFNELDEALDEIYSGAEHQRRRFDFVAKKENKYYVVEVKTNKARLTKTQKEGLQLCRRFGLIPMLIRTKIKISVDKDVTMKIL